MIVVHTILDSMVRALGGGHKVEISGFGAFHLRQPRSRMARNPKTGVRVAVPAKKIPYFRRRRELKAALERP